MSSSTVITAVLLRGARKLTQDSLEFSLHYKLIDTSVDVSGHFRIDKWREDVNQRSGKEEKIYIARVTQLTSIVYNVRKSLRAMPDNEKHALKEVLRS